MIYKSRNKNHERNFQGAINKLHHKTETPQKIRHKKAHNFLKEIYWRQEIVFLPKSNNERQDE